MEQPILQVEHLTKFFSVGPHAEVHAVDDVNFTLRRGRTFGLVGESGCGKSSCARTIIRIYEPSQGKIIFNGQDIAHLKPRRVPGLKLPAAPAQSTTDTAVGSIIITIIK